jgi:hypothetical protein
MVHRIAAMVLVGILTGSGMVSAATPAGFTLYSDACYHRESGDVLGTRIGILRLPEANYAYVQFAEGEFAPPQMVKLQVDAKGISFSAQILAKGPPSVFHGRLTDGALNGEFDDHLQDPSGKTMFVLRKVEIGKKGFPDCK